MSTVQAEAMPGYFRRNIEDGHLGLTPAGMVNRRKVGVEGSCHE